MSDPFVHPFSDDRFWSKVYKPRVYSQSRLAKEYGVSQTLISHIILGRTWGQLRDSEHAEQ